MRIRRLAVLAGAALMLLPLLLTADDADKAQAVELKSFTFKVPKESATLLGHNADDEKLFFYTNGTYTTNLVALNVNPSPGVTFTFGTTNAGGWGASATHPRAFPIICALFMGGVPAMSPATVEGVVNCQ